MLTKSQGTFQGCTYDNIWIEESALDVGGAAIYSLESQVYVMSSTFTNIAAKGKKGGALYIFRNTVSFDNVLFN